VLNNREERTAGSMNHFGSSNARAINQGGWSADCPASPWRTHRSISEHDYIASEVPIRFAALIDAPQKFAREVQR